MDKDLEDLIKKIEQENEIQINKEKLQIPTSEELVKLFAEYGSHFYDDEWEEGVCFSNFKDGFYLAKIFNTIGK